MLTVKKTLISRYEEDAEAVAKEYFGTDEVFNDSGCQFWTQSAVSKEVLFITEISVGTLRVEVCDEE